MVPNDPEFEAMDSINKTLMGLDEGARKRVVQWINGKFPDAESQAYLNAIAGKQDAFARSTKKRAKPLKTGRTRRGSKHTATVADKLFLKKIDDSNPNFSDFLDQLNLGKRISATLFVACSVYYICDVLEEEKASLSKIAACFKSDPRGTMPDAFTVVVRQASTRSRYIHYSSPEDITPASRGRKFIKESMVSKEETT